MVDASSAMQASRAANVARSESGQAWGEEEGGGRSTPSPAVEDGRLSPQAGDGEARASLGHNVATLRAEGARHKVAEERSGRRVISSLPQSHYAQPGADWSNWDSAGALAEALQARPASFWGGLMRPGAKKSPRGEARRSAESAEVGPWSCTCVRLRASVARPRAQEGCLT